MQVDGKQFAIQVDSIAEVIDAVEAITFIDKPPGIHGLINLRGEIVPIHDLRHYLGGPTRELVATDEIVIVNDGAVKIGIAVDGIDTVKTYLEDQLFAQSLSPNAFRILRMSDRRLVIDDIRTLIEL
jgi:chemotaxis signal transduction protein